MLHKSNTPVRELLFKPKYVNFVNDCRVPGIEPPKLLLPKSRVSRPFKEPTLDALRLSDPVKEFAPKLSAVNLVSLVTVVSAGPVSLFSCTSNTFKDVKDDRLVGKGPVKRFRLKSRVSRSSKPDKLDGILPLMLLPSRLRLVSTVSLPRLALIWPLKLL